MDIEEIPEVLVDYLRREHSFTTLHGCSLDALSVLAVTRVDEDQVDRWWEEAQRLGPVADHVGRYADDGDLWVTHGEEGWLYRTDDDGDLWLAWSSAGWTTPVRVARRPVE